ncbi:MAG: iron-sulfur cluster assembly scaffold protein [Thermodesulfobacteriota bacterium]|nr:iron-sulfur cluster assembly scaffold protein [Thermodesulfobacteriota bacterium]
MTEEYASDLDKIVAKMQEAIIKEARETFSEEVVKRWLKPTNNGIMKDPDGTGCKIGTCGDTMEIYLKIKDNIIINAMFITDGCGTTHATGSMVTDLAIDKSIREAMKISQDTILNALGGLPEDSKHCALLASDTLKDAIKDYFSHKNEPWKKVYRK